MSETATTVLKEIVIAVLALLTLGALFTAYWMLVKLPVGEAAPSIAAQARMANLDKVASALFGIFAAFVGYYAGRVPAERAAAASQQNADTQKKLADEKTREVKRAKALLSEARVGLQPERVRAMAQSDAVIEKIESFLNEPEG